MATVKVIDQNNKEVGSVELSSNVFEVEVKPELLHLAVRAQLAAKRAGTHQVKTRSFVSGGGKKPWRQKGTGRARAGSIRSPIWRGGAIVHGPEPRDYSFKLNRKVRQLAVKMALSSKLATEELTVVEALSLPEVKTKAMAGLCDTLGLKKALIVLSTSDNTLELSARNIPGIKIVRPDMLCVYDILKHDRLVFVKDAVSAVEERLK